MEVTNWDDPPSNLFPWDVVDVFRIRSPWVSSPAGEALEVEDVNLQESRRATLWADQGIVRDIFLRKDMILVKLPLEYH